MLQGGSVLGNGTWLNVGGNQAVTWGGLTAQSQKGGAPYDDPDGGQRYDSSVLKVDLMSNLRVHKRTVSDNACGRCTMAHGNVVFWIHAMIRAAIGGCQGV